MILHGNQRGGAKNLALHLLNDENEHVEVHELRGFVSDDLVSALNEIYAVDALIFKQLETRQALQKRIDRLRQFNDYSRQSLERDRAQYHEIADKKRETVQFPRFSRQRSTRIIHRGLER